VARIYVSTEFSNSTPLRLTPRVALLVEHLRVAGHDVLLAPIDSDNWWGMWYGGQCRQFLSSVDVFVSVDGHTGSTWMAIELEEAGKLAAGTGKPAVFYWDSLEYPFAGAYRDYVEKYATILTPSMEEALAAILRAAESGTQDEMPRSRD